MNVERALPVCYRHPDRETRLACTACNRPVCVDCVRRAEVGQRCPECATPRPSVAPSQGGAPVSFGVLIAALAVFVLGFLAVDLQVLLFEQGAQANRLVAAGDYHRLITSGFLHAGIAHILFNMWALYLFGPPLERDVGSAPFAGLYFASMLAGGAVFFVLGPPGGLAVGASGAIFGLFGAWLGAAWRSRHSLAGRASLRQLLLLLGINAVLPFVVPRIAWEAHLGGFLAGLVISLAWIVLRTSPRATLLRTLVTVVVGLAALGLVAASAGAGLGR